jgi:G:T/U-mismatch repair DNA glycosylase
VGHTGEGAAHPERLLAIRRRGPVLVTLVERPDAAARLWPVVERATARADQLSSADFLEAAAAFEHKIGRYAPRFVAFLGKAPFSALSGRRDIRWGRQSAGIGTSGVWVLPNPSGRNRAFSLDRLVGAYHELQKEAFGQSITPSPG